MKMAKATSIESSAEGKAAKPTKSAKNSAPSKPSVFERLGTYFRDVRGEMTRVVWPARPEVLNSSVVVVTTLIFFILFIVLVDYAVVVPIIGAISKIKFGG
jgi:preprotein translocase subunit SecE